MGCYDSVIVDCPSCGATIEFQSKAGDCALRDFAIHRVPTEIVADLDGASNACACGRVVTIKSVYPIQRFAPMALTET